MHLEAGEPCVCHGMSVFVPFVVVAGSYCLSAGMPAATSAPPRGCDHLGRSRGFCCVICTCFALRHMETCCGQPIVLVANALHIVPSHVFACVA